MKLSETKSELKVVADQHGIPTSCMDLSLALAEVIDHLEDREYSGRIFHFSNTCSVSLPLEKGGRGDFVSWADFARTIFEISEKQVSVIDCTSSEYPTRAKRPEWSILRNDSDIRLPDWKNGLERYLGILWKIDLGKKKSHILSDQ